MNWKFPNFILNGIQPSIYWTNRSNIFFFFRMERFINRYFIIIITRKIYCIYFYFSFISVILYYLMWPIKSSSWAPLTRSVLLMIIVSASAIWLEKWRNLWMRDFTRTDTNIDAPTSAAAELMNFDKTIKLRLYEGFSPIVILRCGDFQSANQFISSGRGNMSEIRRACASHEGPVQSWWSTHTGLTNTRHRQ